MTPRRAVTALLLMLGIAIPVVAQDSAEFGRATSSEILMAPKRSNSFSGSMRLSLASGSEALGIAAGGSLIQDRLWFFGSASMERSSAIGGRLNGQIGSAHDFSAFFEAERGQQISMTAPSSFLSLRYTGIVSSNAFFTASVSRSSRTLRSFDLVPVE